jgi:YHS domain-containing protein
MSKRLGILTFALLMPFLMGADKAKVKADQKALIPLQGYIGAWKGVGRPKRSSPKGSWSEKAAWTWKFNDSGAVLAFTCEKGKYFKSGKIAPGKKAGTYVLTAVPASGKGTEVFIGAVDKKKKGLVVTAKKAKSGRPAQITFRLVASGNRLIMMFERKLGAIYTRLAEVGYTREGGGFAKGAGGPECIVTGGKGTITVSYKGKTYYVCCGGCKELFDDDPVGIIKDAAKRAKEEADD